MHHAVARARTWAHALELLDIKDLVAPDRVVVRVGDVLEDLVYVAVDDDRADDLHRPMFARLTA